MFGEHVRQNFDSMSEGAFQATNGERSTPLLRADGDGASFPCQKRGSPLPSESSADDEDISPVSVSSVEFVGYQLNDDEMVFNVQMRNGVSIRAMSSRESVDDDDFQIVHDWTSLLDADGSAVHPARQALSDANPGADIVPESRIPQLRNPLGLQLDLTTTRAYRGHEPSLLDEVSSRVADEPVELPPDVPRAKKATRRMTID